MPNKSTASVERLKFSNFKLRTLLNITRAINNNSSVEELLGKYCNLLRDELNIGKLLIYIYQKPDWKIILSEGINSFDYQDAKPEVDFAKFKEIDVTTSIKTEKFGVFDFIIPVAQENNPLAYVFIGDFEGEQAGISPTIKHLHFIQTLTNIIIVAIENKRLLEENMQQERIKQEMETAAQMQSMLVPKADIFANDKNIEVVPFYFPHYDVGGDYYDFDYLGDNKEEMFFCIADVSGKGMSAAILMSNFQASLKALFTADMELKDLIRRLNTIIVKNSKGERFITLFIGRYNFKNRILKYINAGHNSPILYDKTTCESKYLKCGCPGIGMLDEIIRIDEGEIFIANNSKLLCFTDGVVELEKDGIPDYGQRVVESNMATDFSIKDTLQVILKELDIQRSNLNLFDDITILGIEFFA